MTILQLKQYNKTKWVFVLIMAMPIFQIQIVSYKIQIRSASLIQKWEEDIYASFFTLTIIHIMIGLWNKYTEMDKSLLSIILVKQCDWLSFMNNGRKTKMAKLKIAKWKSETWSQQF